MSATTPEPVGLRQRASVLDEADEVKTANPSSLSGNTKDVPRNKPNVKPPFADVPMSRFLLYLSLGLLTIAAFYTWRFTVYAASVGGYWNVVTGKRPPPVTPGELAISAAGSVASNAASKASAGANSAVTSISSKAKSKATSNTNSNSKTTSSDEDVQTQIFNLALALGVKPHELSAAIRPLIDPTVPNPAEAAQREAELLKAQIAAGGAVGGAAPEQAKEEHGPGLLAALGEALLD